jgi:hypothetical protein
LGGRGTAIIATKQASHAAGSHDSTALPKRRLVATALHSASHETSVTFPSVPTCPPSPRAHPRITVSESRNDDNSPRSLTEKILERPRVIERIRDNIADPERAYLTVYNSTNLERQLADATIARRSTSANAGLNGDIDGSATRGTFREALECGGDEPPLWEGGGTAIIATKQASHAAGSHDSTALPKRWLVATALHSASHETSVTFPSVPTP